MSLSNTNVGVFPFRVVQGVTTTLTLRITGYPDLRTIDWSARVTDLATKEVVFEPDITTPDATTLVATFAAVDLADLEVSSGKYGYGITGNLSAVVYMPIKGRLDVERSDT